MVKIGEVEFLVKFDNVGKQFKDLIKDAMGTVDFDTEDIMDKLKGIQAHLGLLVTPFSGNRLIDLVKSKGYLTQLNREEWVKAKEETISADPMLLKKLGMGELVPGSEEAKEATREQFEIIRKDIAEFIRLTLSSDLKYHLNLPTLNDIISFLTSATEGNWPSLMEKIIDKLKPEVEVDKAVFKWLEDDLKINVGRTQRIWDELSKKAQAKEEINVVKTYEDFVNLLGETLKDDPNKAKLLEEIFFGGPGKPSQQLLDFVKNLTEENSFEIGLQVPRVFRKVLEKALEMDKDALFGATLSNIKSDLKLIVEDVNTVQPLVEKMGKHLSDPEKALLIDKAMKAIEEFGWYFFRGESKTFGSERKFQEELKKYTSGEKELLFAAYMGDVFPLFSKIIGSQIPVEKVLEQMSITTPEKIVEMLVGNKELIEQVIKYVDGLGPEFAASLSWQMQEKLENIRTMVTFGED